MVELWRWLVREVLLYSLLSLVYWLVVIGAYTLVLHGLISQLKCEVNSDVKMYTMLWVICERFIKSFYIYMQGSESVDTNTFNYWVLMQCEWILFYLLCCFCTQLVLAGVFCVSKSRCLGYCFLTEWLSISCPNYPYCIVTWTVYVSVQHELALLHSSPLMADIQVEHWNVCIKHVLWLFILHYRSV